MCGILSLVPFSVFTTFSLEVDRQLFPSHEHIEAFVFINCLKYCCVSRNKEAPGDRKKWKETGEQPVGEAVRTHHI